MQNINYIISTIYNNINQISQTYITTISGIKVYKLFLFLNNRSWEVITYRPDEDIFYFIDELSLTRIMYNSDYPMFDDIPSTQNPYYLCRTEEEYFQKMVTTPNDSYLIPLNLVKRTEFILDKIKENIGVK